MNRNDIEMEYRIENGRITNPGTYEGQPLYAPYFWDLWLNGMFDDQFIGAGERLYTMHRVDSEDVVHFPEFEDIEVIILSKDDNGFIYAQPNTLERWVRIKEQDEN